MTRSRGSNQQEPASSPSNAEVAVRNEAHGDRSSATETGSGRPAPKRLYRSRRTLARSAPQSTQEDAAE